MDSTQAHPSKIDTFSFSSICINNKSKNGQLQIKKKVFVKINFLIRFDTLEREREGYDFF